MMKTVGKLMGKPKKGRIGNWGRGKMLLEKIPRYKRGGFRSDRTRGDLWGKNEQQSGRSPLLASFLCVGVGRLFLQRKILRILLLEFRWGVKIFPPTFCEPLNGGFQKKKKKN